MNLLVYNMITSCAGLVSLTVEIVYVPYFMVDSFVSNWSNITSKFHPPQNLSKHPM